MDGSEWTWNRALFRIQGSFPSQSTFTLRVAFYSHGDKQYSNRSHHFFRWSNFQRKSVCLLARLREKESKKGAFSKMISPGRVFFISTIKMPFRLVANEINVYHDHHHHNPRGRRKKSISNVFVSLFFVPLFSGKDLRKKGFSRGKKGAFPCLLK